MIPAASNFNPLPPHGGRLCCTGHGRKSCAISIHSLRMEGDVKRYFVALFALCISIHSLRMEGDEMMESDLDTLFPFQSTPSAWRETSYREQLFNGEYISIHSLRMEGDEEFYITESLSDIFQSTPSAWRETLNTTLSAQAFTISIHSLRMEGD